MKKITIMNKRLYTEEELKKAWENGYSYSVHRNETIMKEKYKKFLEKFAQ